MEKCKDGKDSYSLIFVRLAGMSSAMSKWSLYSSPSLLVLSNQYLFLVFIQLITAVFLPFLCARVHAILLF